MVNLNRESMERLRRLQAQMRHDQGPFHDPRVAPSYARVLTRAEEIERDWPVQSDPGDERDWPTGPEFEGAKAPTLADVLARLSPDERAAVEARAVEIVTAALCGPFGRVTEAPRSAEDIHD